MKHRKGYLNIVFWFPVIFCMIFVAKHCASRSLHKISSVTSMSKWRLLSFIVFIFIVAVPFLSITSSIIWAYARRNKPSTCFLSLGPSGQSNETNSQKTNRNLTGTTYHWSVILRINFSVVSNSAKRDANGFFKALSLSSYLWIRDILSEHQSLVHKQ